jgi:hypothetical protein
MAVWYSLWSFGIFSRFGMFGPRKIWQPSSAGGSRSRGQLRRNLFPTLQTCTPSLLEQYLMPVLYGNVSATSTKLRRVLNVLHPETLACESRVFHLADQSSSSIISIHTHILKYMHT